MSIDITTDLLAPSGATIKFTEEGEIHRILIEDSKTEQVKDFMTGEPATWDDGNPKMQYVFIGTEDGEPAKLYLKAWGGQKAALTEAFKAAGVKAGESLKGGTLIVKFEGLDEPTRPGLSGAKRFRMKYEPAKTAIVDDDLI